MVACVVLYGRSNALLAVQDGLRPKGYGQGRVVVRPVCLRDANGDPVFRVVPVAVVRVRGILAILDSGRSFAPPYFLLLTSPVGLVLRGFPYAERIFLRTRTSRQIGERLRFCVSRYRRKTTLLVLYNKIPIQSKKLPTKRDYCIQVRI